ncbi:hypothetical protein BG004_001506 [Podila humilis]|nr:hypothetical protein BG004_001506 [Podila humilis]
MLHSDNDNSTVPALQEPMINITLIAASSSNNNTNYTQHLLADTSPSPPSTFGQTISSLSPIAVDASFWPHFMAGLLPPSHPHVTEATTDSFQPDISLTPPPPPSLGLPNLNNPNNNINPCEGNGMKPRPTEQVSTVLLQQMTSLARHLAFQGFIQGVGSDITIGAFGKIYRLHRMVLTQSPLFENMLQKGGPWKEHDTDRIDLVMNDPNITVEGFEIALGRLYGILMVEEEDEEEEEVEEGREEEEREGEEPQSSQNHNHQQQPEFTVVFAGSQALYASRLTTDNALSVLAASMYLGIESLCAQCTSFILRALSAKRVVEYVRFTHRFTYFPWSNNIAEACHTFLCRNGFDHPKIKSYKVFEQLPATWLPKVIGSDVFWVPSEWDRYLFCRQIVTERRKQARASLYRCRRTWRKVAAEKSEQVDNDNDDNGDDEEAAYEKLFSKSIIYIYMTLEQLQLILHDYEPWTLQPFTPSNVVHESFWFQTELRAMIESAPRVGQSCLGLMTTEPRQGHGQGHNENCHAIRDCDPIPVVDMACVVPMVLPYNDPEELASHVAVEIEKPPSLPQQMYATCAPFRFSVQFRDVSKLDYGVRIYSRNFYYAGSHWNVYVQKRPLKESKTQLGIFLHRQAEAIPVTLTRRTQRPVFSPPFLHNDSPRAAALLLPAPSPSKNAEQCLVGGQGDESAEEVEEEENEDTARLPNLAANDTVPIEESFSCFADKRTNTRTWFRVYAASVGPWHHVTQFQAAPDDFQLMHSWGWNSPDLYTTCYLPDLETSANRSSTTTTTNTFDPRHDSHTLEKSRCKTSDPLHGGEPRPGSMQLKLSFVMGHL